jgi:hypothetical protein
MVKIALTNQGVMPDIPEKLKELYDKDKMLVLLKGRKLTRRELIERCKENRTFEDYTFTNSTYYKWIREWLELGLVQIEGEGRNTVISLTENGNFVTDSGSSSEFFEKLSKLGAL